MRPDWNSNNAQHQTLLKAYQILCLQALREAAVRPVNYSAITNVWQEKNESPTAFLSRLIEAYKVNTGLDMETAQNRPLLIERFITQSAPDIRRKLQRTEGALGKNIAEIMEIARKVFRNRDKEEERKSDQKEKKKAEMLAVALGGMNIGPNQCAICKQEGHWQRECPQRNGQPRGQSRQYGRGRGRGFRGTFQRSYRGSFKGRGHPAYPNQTEEREENMIGLADMEWED